MLIVIVLMGMVVSAVLVGIRVTVKASAVDRDHAAAFAWLQAGSDAVHAAPRVPCTPDGQGRIQAIAAYDAVVRTVPPPPVWDGRGSISVTNVEYLGRAGIDDVFSWSPAFCFEGGAFAESPLFTQRITIRVVFPNSSSVQTLEMVKSE
jgi:hypothetical protein